MNITLSNLREIIDLLEGCRDNTFDGALRHSAQIHAISLLLSRSELSKAESLFLDNTMARAHRFIDSHLLKDEAV